jgi:hypothetical protein
MMSNSQKDLIIKYLIQHQKAKDDWDTARKKIPDDLLMKWASVILECRLNGFMSPRIHNNSIIWKQVTGAKRNYKNADQCTLCPNTYVGGECKGVMTERKGFVPCWIGGN